MKSVFLLLALSTTCCAAGPPRPPDVFEQNRKLGRGVNILGYDPIWRSREQARFQPKHFQRIKEAGFTTVRVNLHPFRHMDRDAGWALRPAWWEILDWTITHATRQGLMVILDLHEFNAVGADPENHKERFLAFWRQVSAHCRNAPDAVLFELLNEPCKKLTPALWNDWLREGLAVLRAENPTRPVVIGPGNWNSVDALPALQLPETDTNIILTVHYYKPFPFTHQGAPWAGLQDKLGVDWQGTADERAAIQHDFDKVAAWAKARNRPVFLGEFGAYDKAPMDARVRYLRAVAQAAEARGWSWAYWQFDSDFLLWDMKRDTWVEPILQALIPSPPTPPGR